MKNILLVGPSRAGKTTLAKKINAELGHFVVSLDKLVATMQGAYPQLDIRLNWNREKTAENLAPFIGHFLGMFSCDQGSVHALNLHRHAVKGNRFVMEGGYFHFQKVFSILKTYGIEEAKDKFLLIGLVQNHKTVDAFIKDLKAHDTQDDWTYGLHDRDLREVAADAVASSQAMTAQLLAYGFTVYDTSADRERVLQQIIEDIRRNMAP